MNKILSTVFTILLTNFLVFSNYTISGKSIFLYKSTITDSSICTPTAETIAKAEEIVHELSKEVVFSISYLNETTTTDKLYNIAKSVVPEVEAFEAMENATIALIAVYEELIARAENFDFKEYFSTDIDTLLTTENEMFRIGSSILGERNTIEALLSLDCYYDRLDNQEIQRMIEDFEKLASIIESARNANNVSYEPSILFYQYCGYREMNNDSERIGSGSIEDNKLNVTATNSGVFNTGYSLYTLGTVVYTTGRKDVQTFYAQNEMTDSEKTSLYGLFYNNSKYPDLTYVSEATTYYNCHAFAWYSTSPGRKWIGNNMQYQGSTLYGVERFISDSHCTTIGSSDYAAQINDIVVYRSDGEIVHSGIVVGKNPIRIKSKWGSGCVWIHDKTTVPGAYKNSSGTIDATYYRYSKSHDYSYSSVSSSKHRATCTTCGYSRLDVHVFIDDTNVCTLCGYCNINKLDHNENE